MHDTFTISEDLLINPNDFYSVAESIVGSNFLVAPHEIAWLGDQHCFFESEPPPWLDIKEPNGLASWILFFMERALCV